MPVRMVIIKKTITSVGGKAEKLRAMRKCLGTSVSAAQEGKHGSSLHLLPLSPGNAYLCSLLPLFTLLLPPPPLLATPVPPDRFSCAFPSFKYLLKSVVHWSSSHSLRKGTLRNKQSF